MLSISKTSAVAVAMAMCLTTTANAESCSDGKTLTSGALVIATGNPAYSPWVMNDSPESKVGYEAAIGWEVAKRLGFADESVTWVRSTFDEAIQPGEKNFDFNIQQFSILPEREAVIDFSDPYYVSSKAVIVAPGVAETMADTSIESIRKLQFGAASGQTSAAFIQEYIKPEAELLLYDDMADVTSAMQAGQAQATVFDLPTAMFVTAVRYPEAKIIGQFAEDRSIAGGGDAFGIVFSEGNPLRECVNKVLAEMQADGTVAGIESKWLAESAGVPVISLK